MNIILIGCSILYVLIFFVIIGGRSILFDIKIKNIEYEIYFTLLLISLCVIAYYSIDIDYGTYEGWDVNRYFYNINQMRGGGFKHAFEITMYPEAPLTTLLFYFVSLLPNNHYLKVFGVFIPISIILYIIYDSIKNKKCKSSSVFITLIFILSVNRLVGYISGIRQGIATSLCVLAIYIENKKNSKLLLSTIPLYICALLFHISVFFIIIIRICSIGNFKIFKYILLLWPVLLLPIFKYFSTMNDYLYYVYERLLVYSEIKYEDLRLYIVQMFIVVLLGYIMYLKNKNEILLLKRENKQLIYNSFAFVTGSVQIYHLFSRSNNFLTLIMIPNIIDVIDKEKYYYVRLIMLFISAGLIAYEGVFAYNFWRFLI